ncbi:MAG: uroporphyrinogen-III synthase [Ignavibacteriae bacterium]|nr:uroporphyrinogen-III synthase [Ignavibacteriota bacterium]
MVLAGKTILITRAAHQAEELVKAVERRGGTPLVFPTIEITPPDSWDACDRALDSLYMYDGLIFTSSNGVEFFFERLNTRGFSPGNVRSKMICVVGEKTKESVERLGLHVTKMPEKFTALELSKSLQQEDLNGKSFLFPRGNLGTTALADSLKHLGAHVDSVIVYHTQKPSRQDAERILKLLLDRKVDVVTFTSPSTVKYFVTVFPNQDMKGLLQHTKIAVIGPATAGAVEDLGLNVDIIAKKSTVESLVSTIEEYFQSKINNLKSKITA